MELWGANPALGNGLDWFGLGLVFWEMVGLGLSCHIMVIVTAIIGFGIGIGGLEPGTFGNFGTF